MRKYLLVYGPLILLSGTMLFPLFWMATASFKHREDVFTATPKILPGFGVDDAGDGGAAGWFYEPTAEHYPNLFVWRRAMGDEAGGAAGPQRFILLDGFGRFLLNNLFYALAITIGQVTTSSLAAFAFARLRFPGRDKLFLAYLGTMMIPFTVTMIPSYVLLREIGWIDTYKGVMLPLMFSAYGTFMLRQFFKTVPQDIEDAARIDGCSEFGLYWRIMLPLSTPALATLMIITFVGAWRTFMWPLIVCSSEDIFNLPLGLTMFRSLFGEPNWPLLMAGSIVMTLPMIIVFMAGQRYFVEGIRLGAVKG